MAATPDPGGNHGEKKQRSDQRNSQAVVPAPPLPNPNPTSKNRQNRKSRGAGKTREPPQQSITDPCEETFRILQIQSCQYCQTQQERCQTRLPNDGIRQPYRIWEKSPRPTCPGGPAESKNFST